MLKYVRFSFILSILLLDMFSTTVCAVTLSNFDVINNSNKLLVTLDFQGVPVYNFYFLHHPERFVLEVSHIFSPLYFKKFPINFVDGPLVHRIRAVKLTHGHGMRFIFDLVSVTYVDDVLLEKKQGVNTLLLVMTKQLSVSFLGTSLMKKEMKKEKGFDLSSYINVFLLKKKHPFVSYMGRKSRIFPTESCQMKMFFPIMVAIDAGHGGHDPGAKGHSGVYEKNITISIARKFKKLLDQDPIFSSFMIRDGDYFISVSDRSELARSKGAKVLLSIHADAISKNSKNNVRGSSVWVLSDRGANIEMLHWLENRTKRSQLSSGVNDVLVTAIDNSDRYLKRAILDVQFCHSQRVGYEIASHILRELKNIGVLHKYVPEYSNFAVLRSLNIPSVLVETGFITHAEEEKLLVNDYYQEKIAYALYKGLRSYFLGYISDFENGKSRRVNRNFGNYGNNHLYKNYKYKCTSF